MVKLVRPFRMFIGMLFVTIGMISIYDLWGALAM